MPKITLIGAGSIGFARRLLGDILSLPEFRGATVSLMDIDAKRLELIAAFSRKLVRDAGASAAIQATTDRREALEGADYVLATIRVGDTFELDRGIPPK